MKGVAARFPSPQRILVRGVNWLGDAVMTTPALQRLRQRFPHAQIGLLTAVKLAPLWQGHPDIDRLLAFQPGESPWKIGGRLREERFDAALVLPNSPRSALECWWGRVPLRIGYGHAWRRWLLNGRVPFPEQFRPMRKRSAREVRRLLEGQGQVADSDLRGPIPERAHQVYHYLHLAAALGADPAPLAPRLHVGPEELAGTAEKFGLGLVASSHPGGHAPGLLGLNPGAEYGPAKRWPAASFVEAVNQVNRAGRFQWLIFGGPADAAVAGEIAAGIQSGSPGVSVCNLAGRTSLRELMALLKLCRVVLTNDTGPMHVAAALGTRVVVPFGSTSPELTGPGIPGSRDHAILQARVPCSPCFLRTCPAGLPCMQSLQPARAAVAVLGMAGD